MMSQSLHAQQKPNKLIHSTSPYLLQHAYNPVHWEEWNTESLQRAQKEAKPILVSIGYSSCHWCHVMERESFEDERIAHLMNNYFICIKVDREERPDIDQVYMDAVQAMGIHGGWPLNVFLTPDQKPFYGGTYFPPAVWTQLLTNIHQAFQTRKNEINKSADELTRVVSESNLQRFRAESEEQWNSSAQKSYEHVSASFDTTWGGLAKAPKFIMPTIWLWLLRYYHVTKKDESLHQVTLTLNKILEGGIYDQLGGGFARYSVDNEWFVPHFEKMLYDNAQLLSLYAEAFQVTKKDDYRNVVEETFTWLQTEMRHPEGGYYSALDADSEGEEGKFYVWLKKDIDRLLGTQADRFCAFYGITEEGNWEGGKNILKRIVPVEQFLTHHSLSRKEWGSELRSAKSILLAERNTRVRPGLDDKIVCSWNALLIIGLVDAWHALHNDRYLAEAKHVMSFVKNKMSKGTVLARTYKNKPSTTEGFLEDYALTIRACIKLYQTEFDEKWLDWANDLTLYVLNNFYDPSEDLFYFTSTTSERLIARKKEIFDNVIPSSNSIMAMNLYHLAILLGKPAWHTMAEKMTNGFGQLIEKELNYMSNWGIALMEIKRSLAEVAIVGSGVENTCRELYSHHLPFAIFSGTKTSSELPVLHGKTALNQNVAIYVCKHYQCQQPVSTVEEALPLITNKS